MLTMEEAMKQVPMRFVAGEIVKGTIIEVRPKEVLVDIGYKSEGVVGGNEFVAARSGCVPTAIEISPVLGFLILLFILIIIPQEQAGKIMVMSTIKIKTGQFSRHRILISMAVWCAPRCSNLAPKNFTR